MVSTQKLSAAEEFERLVSLMQKLRAPEGCPWDREQDFDSIKPYTLEETYEVLDAIDARDWSGLKEELGDFILQAVFYAQMATEAGHFDIGDSLRSVNEKLIRRHPHIFGTGTAVSAAEVKENWDRIKATEKQDRGTELLLDSVPRSVPALNEAARISSKAAGSGFDWPDVNAVFAKLEEELTELAAARGSSDSEEIEAEIGDVLFTLVNMARFFQVDPEQALRKTNAKFRRRFAHVEKSLLAQGRTLKTTDLAEMEALWQDAKRDE